MTCLNCQKILENSATKPRKWCSEACRLRYIRRTKREEGDSVRDSVRENVRAAYGISKERINTRSITVTIPPHYTDKVRNSDAIFITSPEDVKNLLGERFPKPVSSPSALQEARTWYGGDMELVEDKQ